MIQRIVRPGVEVQQVFLQTNPSLVNPDLPTVIVGPNIQIVDEAAGGNFVKGQALVMAYPELEGGAKVKLASVVVKMTVISLDVFTGGAMKATVNGDKITIAPALGDPDFTTKGVKAGDDFIAWDGVDTYKAKVLKVDSATSLTLDRDLPFAAPVDFKVERAHADVVLPADAITATADDVTVKAGLTVAGLLVETGKAKVTYRALRMATANRLTSINNAAEIEGKLMKLSVENPLALGVFCAKANTVSSIQAMAIEDESPLGWLTALSFLQNEPVYTVVLLTQDPTVQGMVKAHVEQMSLPEKSKFRIAFINLSHPRESVVVEPLELAKIKREAGVLTISQPNATFSGTVLVGDFVKVTARTGDNPTADPTLAAFYKVLEVKNNSTLKLESAKYSGSEGTYTKTADITVDFAADTVDMSVLRVLDKDGQANAIAQIANSYNSRRITYVTNHEVVVTVGSKDEVVPGFYLAAAYGGMNAGNPPHQGFTNLGVVGIKSVRYANRYFNDDQLGLVAGSGGFVVTQEVEGALPAAYLQTTTDNSSIQRRELSVTKTLDFYSLGLKKLMSSFIGPYNLIPATLTALKNAANGYHTFLLGQNYDKIGTPILSGEIKELKEDALEPDVARLVTQIDIPLPLNRVRARVEVLG